MGDVLIVGANEGDSEGRSVGFGDGCALGDTEGTVDGMKEGIVVAPSDGEALKSVVGGLEGSVDGTDTISRHWVLEKSSVLGACVGG